ncbi:MAG TPA: rod shape-determining protein RodA [Firmicutes bacterium]|nr:rod shape-determining protein RodA [Bacillota bacterium]
MFNRRLLKNFDYPLLLITLTLCCYGLIVLSSATQGLSSDPLFFVRKQAIWIGMGVVAILLAISIDYIKFYRWSWYFYALNLLLLGLVIFFGRDMGGASWLDLIFFDFQPSELAKLIVIITLARLLADYRERVNRFWSAWPFFLHIIPVILLIMLQPDLGTALVFVIIFFAMLYMAGIPVGHLAIVVTAGIAAFPLFWLKLMDYQKMRLLVFLNPGMDPLGYGYQLRQSMIAIGSGGISGKGLFEGTQARLQFLPEQHTDFIFSVLGEELGMLGAIVLLMLYLCLIYRILKIGAFAKDCFSALVCTGVASMITFQILVNVGMAIGIMPVTGLPLPFMSYGGSSMLTNMLAIGVILNMGMRRQKIQF